MRALICVIAFVSILIGPSLAGPANSDLPGIGTFAYSGPPLRLPATAIQTVFALGR